MSRLFMPVAIEGVFAWISRLSEETEEPFPLNEIKNEIMNPAYPGKLFEDHTDCGIVWGVITPVACGVADRVWRRRQLQTISQQHANGIGHDGGSSRRRIQSPCSNRGAEYYSDEAHDANFPPPFFVHEYEEVVNGVRLESLD